MKKTLLLAAIAAFYLQGCATVVNGQSDTIRLTSSPHADFVVRDKEQKVVTRGTTPANINVDRKSGYFSGEKYTVDFSKAEYEPKSTVIDSKLSPYYFLNIIIGGIPGLLIIDPLTGGMWDFQESSDTALTKSK